MPEYIERDVVLQKNMRGNVNSITYRTYAEILIKSIPAADVVEVKHGENVTKMNPVDEFICSECGLILRDVSEVRIDDDNEDECYFEFEFKYCPNCGAKIRE